MSWDTIIGHDEPIGQLRSALASGRLHPSLLFEGPEGVGKKLVALTLARALHCPQAAARGGDPCGACRVCRAVTASAEPMRTEENQSEHAGVRVVTPSRPDERETRFGAPSARGEVRSQITVPQIRVVIAEGAQRGLVDSCRLVIIDPADAMNESAANALLKTLEEPRPRERFVLVTARPSVLLPTIRSRCLRFRFGLLSPDDVRRVLATARRASERERSPRGEEGHGAASRPSVPRAGADARGGRRGEPGEGDDSDLVASLAGGRIGRALALIEGPALRRFRDTRALLLDSLEALAAGLPAGTFAVVTAAGMGVREREAWLEAIEALELLLRDIAVLAADPGTPPVNVDEVDRLRRLAEPLGAAAARALPVLDSVRRDFRVNVNARLAMERILLEVSRP